MTQGSVLGVWAHPDDEAWLSAGIMMHAINRGDRVVCVTATYGEQGASDPERFPPDVLIETRKTEMRKSLNTLGVSEHHWLGFPDGGCAEADHSEGVTRIADVIADVQPEFVLTFGPDGMTGHTDHQTVSAWTTQAFAKVAPNNSQLLYATNTPEFVRQSEEMFEQLNIMMADQPMPEHSIEELALYLALEGELLERKVQALRAQESQIAPIYEHLGHERFVEACREEAFWAPPVFPG